MTSTGAETRPPKVRTAWTPAVVVATGVAAAGLGIFLVMVTERWGAVLAASFAAFLVVGLLVVWEIRLVALLFFLTLPVGLVGLGPLQVVEVMALALVVAGVVHLTTVGWARAPRASVIGSLGAVLLAAGLATVFSEAADLTFRADVLVTSGVLLTLALTVLADTWPWIYRLLAAVLGGGALIAAHALATLGSQSASFGGAVVDNRARGVFSQPNELGMMTAALLVLAVAMLLTARTWLQRTAVAAVVAVTAAASLMSLSRGSWLGALLGVSALAIMLPPIRRRLAVGAMAVLGATVVLGALVGTHPALAVVRARVASLAGPTSNPYDDRPAIYAEAVHQVAERPILGHGPGVFEEVARATSGTELAVEATHAHNLVLTIATEYGVVGVAALLALVCTVGVTTWRAVRRLLDSGAQREAAVCAGLGGSLVAVLGHGLLDFPLRNPTTFLICWSLLGLLLAASARQPAGPGSATPASGGT